MKEQIRIRRIISPEVLSTAVFPFLGAAAKVRSEISAFVATSPLIAIGEGFSVIIVAV